MGAVDAIEHRDSSANDELVRRGRVEIEEGIAMIKGLPNAGAGPGKSLQGWGSGLNRANPEATINTAGFPPPHGQEYAQNSTTANMHTDLGRGPNAYSGNTADQPPQYPAPGGAYPPNQKDAGPGGLGYTHPTQMGNRPTTGGMVGQEVYDQRREADQM